MSYTTSDALPLFDPLAIKRLIEDVGAEATQRLTISLRGELTEGVAALEGYILSGDFHMLETKAHALKSAARSFGAMQLGELCMQMEASARKGQSSEHLMKLYDHLSRCMRETVSIMAQLIG